MKILSKPRWLVLIILILSVLNALVALLVISDEYKPPIKEFEAYHRIACTFNFKKNNLYAESMKKAEFFRCAAFEEWQKQNNSFWITRNYSESKRMILMAISMAEEANRKQKEGENLVLNQTNTARLSDNISLQFDQRAIAQLPQWKKWVEEAISYSKDKNTVVLIIDKLNHRCLLVENGFQLNDFCVELGINYLKEKHLCHDFTTPEGVYYIKSKPSDSVTSIYKSMHLNFPNKEDSLRFEQAYKNHKITNLEVFKDRIYLHGEGGKGFDWTDGSIAFTNEDLDILINKVKIGTKVVIVGSTKDILTVSKT